MKFKKAFTMIELVFVIVIMGILAKFGVSLIAQAYNSFIFSKINNELQANSGTAVEFITCRLEHRIKGSEIVRNTVLGTKTPLDGSIADDNATVLEWVGIDIDGFRGSSDLNATPYLPNWSGVIDLDDGNASILVSKETNTTKINTLINTISSSDINDSALYFVGSSSAALNPWGYDGNITDQSSLLHPIKSVPGQIDQFAPNTGAIDFTGERIYEYYQLAWSAYALKLDYNDTTHSGTLWFHYDYQPWKGESYNTHGKSTILMENVSSFQFRSVGSLIKIQVCVKSLRTNQEYSLCKEKTVF
jgi:prepilin-type N-terminal cleavage/methylation domain-containing protein